MVNLAEIKKKDWDMKDADTSVYTATVHPYHAKFIPQLPMKLIEEFTDSGDTILDPFNGCGTTSLASLLTNRKSYGTDLNPLAVEIAKTKVGLIEPNKLDRESKKFLNTIKPKIHYFKDQKSLDSFENSSEAPKTKIPDFQNKESWYIDSVRNQMGVLNYQIDNVEDEKLRRLYRICLSSISKTVSRTDKDYTYVGDRMLPDNPNNRLTPVDKEYDVFKFFKRRLKRAKDGLKELYHEVDQDYVDEQVIKKQDSRNLSFIEDNEVDFVVTSPPYANAVDYARYHRLSFYWLGYSDEFIDEVKEDEIGARAKRGRKSATEDYFEEMGEVLEEVQRVLAPKKYFAMVIGNSQRKKKEIKTVSRLKEIGKEKGLEPVDEIERRIYRQSMSQKEIETESIIIFQSR